MIDYFFYEYTADLVTFLKLAKASQKGFYFLVHWCNNVTMKSVKSEWCYKSYRMPGPHWLQK